MRIGELSRRSGTSRDTIRYYERLGLLPPSPRPHATNRYKHYPAEALTRLRLIRYAKGLGFALADIAPGLDDWCHGRVTAEDKRRALERQLTRVRDKERELAAMRLALESQMAQLDA